MLTFSSENQFPAVCYVFFNLYIFFLFMPSLLFSVYLVYEILLIKSVRINNSILLLFINAGIFFYVLTYIFTFWWLKLFDYYAISTLSVSPPRPFLFVVTISLSFSIVMFNLLNIDTIWNQLRWYIMNCIIQ